MRLEEDIKLDFKDVLIRPKRSTLGSRKEVSLNRKFVFRNSGWKFGSIPIMAANMDGVGTFTMADKLTELNLFTCLVKTYSAKELIEYFKDTQNYKRLNSVAMSIGIADTDLEKWREVRNATDVRYVCIDVANGYSERFSEFVKKFRDEYPTVTIIAGNVVTGEMTEELLLKLELVLAVYVLLASRLGLATLSLVLLLNVQTRLMGLAGILLLMGDAIALVTLRKRSQGGQIS